MDIKVWIHAEELLKAQNNKEFVACGYVYPTRGATAFFATTIQLEWITGIVWDAQETTAHGIKVRIPSAKEQPKLGEVRFEVMPNMSMNNEAPMWKDSHTGELTPTGSFLTKEALNG